MAIQKELTSTTFDIPGYKIVKTLGIARGISVRSLSLGGNILAGLKAMLGGKSVGYTRLCEETRRDALRLLMEHAAEDGANAIIGIRYDANEVVPAITEVLAYGTAVVVEKAS